jgi:hypothetical protein
LPVTGCWPGKENKCMLSLEHDTRFLLNPRRIDRREIVASSASLSIIEGRTRVADARPRTAAFGRRLDDTKQRHQAARRNGFCQSTSRQALVKGPHYF